MKFPPIILSRQDLEAARRDLVRGMIEEYRDDVALLTPSQVMGLLNVNHATLAGMAIPRVEIVPRRVIRYRLRDVKEHIAKLLTD